MMLVFGQSGQLARELARIAPPGTRFLGRAEADLATPGAAAAAIMAARPGAVINAAAWTAVDAAEANEAAAMRINAEAVGEMARACAGLHVPLVQLSTDYVFDGAGDAPFAPDAATAPLSAYGRSKLAGEQAVRAAGGAHAILRTSWVFSAHGSNFVRSTLRLSETRTRIGVVADQIGGPTPAASLARAVLTIAAALRQTPAQSGSYHFAGAPDISWADFAEAIFAASGRAVVVERIGSAAYAARARRPANSRLDCRSTERVFGLARPNWRAGLLDVLNELGVTR